MADRILDPRERALHRARQAYNAAAQERHHAVLSGTPVPRGLASTLSDAEAAIAKAGRAQRMGSCAKCDGKLSFNDPHYRLTVTCVTRFFPGDDDPVDFQQYLSPGMYGRFEAGAAGLVVQLEPPTTGELAFCVDCAKKIGEYLDEQLVDEQDAYRIKIREAAKSKSPATTRRHAKPKATRGSKGTWHQRT